MIGIMDPSIANRITPMNVGMASDAQRDQIPLLVITRSTAELLMVYFQVGHSAAGLASPAIAAEYSCAKFSVFLSIES